MFLRAVSSLNRCLFSGRFEQVSDYSAPIREIIERIHSEHSSDGKFMNCFSCVIAGLNEAEHDYVAKVKERNEER